MITCNNFAVQNLLRHSNLRSFINLEDAIIADVKVSFRRLHFGKLLFCGICLVVWIHDMHNIRNYRLHLSQKLLGKVAFHINWILRYSNVWNNFFDHFLNFRKVGIRLEERHVTTWSVKNMLSLSKNCHKGIPDLSVDNYATRVNLTTKKWIIFQISTC